MKLKCNGCGIIFDKSLSRCIRYNREHKKGLCSKCKIQSNKETEIMLKKVAKEFTL